MHRLVVAVGCAIACCLTPAAADDMGATLVQTGLTDTAFVAIAASRVGPPRIFAASHHALYESADHARTWHERLRLPAHTTATAIAIEPSDLPSILVSTDRGVYGSLDGGRHWTRVFRGVGAAQSDCRYVAFHPTQPGVALLGTRGGLFLSIDQGRRWRSVTAPPALRDVLYIAFDPREVDRLYALTPTALFEGHLRGNAWHERFRTGSAEEIGVEEGLDAQETAGATPLLHLLSAVAVHPQDSRVLYLATSRGLLVSEDAGVTWRGVPQAGLPSLMTTRLALYVHSPLLVYTGTDQGLARFEPATQRWSVLTTGLSAARVHDLASLGHELWAATAQGLVRYSALPDPMPEMEPPSPRDILDDFAHEPTIAQVQQAAIRYAEVHPDKIRRWRRQAALKALLPTFDVSLDRDRSQDINVDEGTYPRFQLIETEDRNSALDVSVRWDLGELLWNNDQTSIDTRSKLMAELREEIVDRVTRTYFERRRLQLALLTSPSTDHQTLLEQELRVQELTALIDGLTGGYLSQEVRPQHRD